MSDNAILNALAEQVECYHRLAKLAQVQHEHIRQGRIEQLLDVLESRQQVLEQMTEYEKIVGPAKRQWEHFVGPLTEEDRTNAELLLAESRSLLEQITAADRDDALVLQQRKLNIGKEIRHATSARQINRMYGAAGLRFQAAKDGRAEMIAHAQEPSMATPPPKGDSVGRALPAAFRPAGSARPTAPADTARRIEELGRIILAYSEVTERLQKSHDQLTQTVESLHRELGDKNRQLERRNRLAALGEMAAGLAHEIRNPLGGIQLYASMLARDLAGRDDALQIVQKISGGVKRLEALVGQVLQFSREIVVNMRPAALPAVIEQAVELAGQAMEERRVTCHVRGPKSMTVTADPVLLGQAVLNLLLNAAEAAEEGEVFVEYGRDDSQFRIIVRDTGSGIPPDVLDRIFNPFFTTRDTGTGLGLSIVHRIVEAHDGTITASNEEGGGARFEIRI